MKNLSNADRAEVLCAALPYIKKYNGKIVVVKYGGNAMINEELKQQVMQDIVLLWLIGVKVVLVHGGSSAKSRGLWTVCALPTKRPSTSSRWCSRARSTRRSST